MGIVRARFRHRVHHAARRAAILRGEAAGPDLELLNRLGADQVGQPRAALGFREEGLVVIHAVDHVVVVQAGHSAETDQSESAVVGRARRGQGEGVPTPAVHRQVHHVFQVHHGADVGLVRLHHGGIGIDDDGLRRGRNLHRQVHDRLLSDRQRDAGAGERGKTGVRSLDFVVTRLESERLVASRIVGRQSSRHIGVDIPDHDVDPRHYGARGIGCYPGYACGAGCGLPKGQGCGAKQGARQDKETHNTGCSQSIHLLPQNFRSRNRRSSPRKKITPQAQLCTEPRPKMLVIQDTKIGFQTCEMYTGH